MRGEPSCPRCGGRVRAPGLFADHWSCPRHGAVPPLQPVLPPDVEVLSVVVRRAVVPVWMLWPLPVGRLYTGVAAAGDDLGGTRAVALACSGPAAQGGTEEILLIAEEPGVGLGAYYAGIEGPGPGAELNPDKPAQVRILAGGLPVSLWRLDHAPADRAVFVGEALGVRLWIVVRPESSGVLLHEDLVLTDLREAGAEVELLPCGALSPTLL